MLTALSIKLIVSNFNRSCKQSNALREKAHSKVFMVKNGLR